MVDEGRIIPIGVEDEMKSSYIDYAMSVIVGRALPDVRDGLKPVHRRILFGMLELGVEPSKSHKKSARIVGEVMGKFHPHGDAAIYESIARMTQTFSLRYPLIDGQGNFGSIDGDPPAAMRYTEAKLKQLSMEILADIEKETVDFMPNFDDSLLEPVVLPSKVPNLLINGSSGIAVGMATNIPPHNLNEVVDALIKLIDKPDISIEEIMTILPGPDFPTGATICGREGIRQAYTTGKGIVVMRGKVEVEEEKKKEIIVIKEIPYEVNKANLVARIAALISESKINGISEVRDESDKEGMRIVLEVKRGENVDIIINQLYKFTPLQTSYGIINLALSNQQPKLLNIKEMLQLFLDHRKEIVLRRTAFDLNKAEERYHIVCGLIIALDNLDKVIQLIRNSKTVEEAKNSLISTFKMSEKQAQAVLAMPLSRLTGLEREKILKEQEDLQNTIKELQGILADPEKVKEIIKGELKDTKRRFGDERRTEIVGSIEDFDELDLIHPEDIIVTVSSEGYIKRTSLELYKRQRRGGKGVIGAKTKEEDYVKHLFVCSTTDNILFFTEKGQVHWLRGYLIPDAGKNAKGKPIVNLLTINTGERIAAVIPVHEFTENSYLLMATQKGIVKKTVLSAYSRPRRGGIRGINLRPKDRLIEVKMTDGTQDIILSTKYGLSIRFSEEEVKPVNRSSIGVIGIRFKKKEDEVVGCEVFSADEKEKSLFTVCSKGFGKRTMIYHYRAQRRGGKGVIDIKTGGRNGYVVGIKGVTPKDDLIIITKGGVTIRIPTEETRTVSRNTSGVTLIKIAQGDKIVDLTLISKENEEI